MILDGQAVAKVWKSHIKERIDALREQGERMPHLAVVIVGSDPASEIYVQSKARQAKEVGMTSTVIAMESDASEASVYDAIMRLNQDASVDGILVQLPLPKHINTTRIIEAIAVDKDVDGLSAQSIGKLFSGQKGLVACTPKGIMHLLDAYDIECESKVALVIGRSKLVGTPIARLLLDRNATVIQAHSKSKDIEGLIAQADIIVVATGIKGFVSGSWLKPHHIVIDVGIHRDEHGLSGDVQKGVDHVRYITPVPKGVGPMTIAALLENTLEAREGHE